MKGLRRGRRDGPIIALAGNPNVGKSTIFNRLTGLHVTTAHYPGTTVEVAIGTAQLDGVKATVVDLPGSYGLGAGSEDQLAARRALIEASPDVVIVILDATNLARNLYMALELLDLGLPVVVALNLMDEAGRAGIQTNVKRLSEALGVTVIPTVAHRGVGVQALLTAALKEAQETPISEQEQPVTEAGQVILVHPEAAQTTQVQVQADQVLAEADDKNKINLFSLFFKLHLIFKTNLFYFNYL